jgi:hypothetical protein
MGDPDSDLKTYLRRSAGSFEVNSGSTQRGTLGDPPADLSIAAQRPVYEWPREGPWPLVQIDTVLTAKGAPLTLRDAPIGSGDSPSSKLEINHGTLAVGPCFEFSSEFANDDTLTFSIGGYPPAVLTREQVSWLALHLTNLCNAPR